MRDQVVDEDDDNKFYKTRSGASKEDTDREQKIRTDAVTLPYLSGTDIAACLSQYHES